MANYRTPGAYIEEVSKLPPSVVAVETAIPVFIGYTEKTQSKGMSLVNRPVAIDSLVSFEQVFGGPPSIGGFVVTVDVDGKVSAGVSNPSSSNDGRFLLAHALRHFYDNGGGNCYVTSIGDYASSLSADDIAEATLAALAAVAREDEPTLIVLVDLNSMRADDPDDDDEVAAVLASYHGVLVQALDQCATLGDRFLLCNLLDGATAGLTGLETFRNGIGTRNLKYGAAYHPFIQTTIGWPWDESSITVSQTATRDETGVIVQPSPHDGLSLLELKEDATGANTAIYANVRKQLDRFSVTLPPTPAVAGVYATVDGTRGVWKSPANESLSSLRSLTLDVDQDLNDAMNVHQTGKSVNALRRFTGRGTLVWGARTLAGNDNEWRYVSVRRFFNMVEESVKNAVEPFVFEPNDANTWTKVKAMIDNFLVLQWRQGALVGAKPDDAFFVRVGLGVTMTAQDILEGRMNVEIGMAVVRPAEFIILRFSQKMQES